jgi:hypothetical protein
MSAMFSCEDDDPPCECIQTDVDAADNRWCPLHGPDGPIAQTERERQAEDERAAAALIPLLLGEE